MLRNASWLSNSWASCWYPFGRKSEALFVDYRDELSGFRSPGGATSYCIIDESELDVRAQIAPAAGVQLGRISVPAPLIWDPPPGIRYHQMEIQHLNVGIHRH